MNQYNTNSIHVFKLENCDALISSVLNKAYKDFNKIMLIKEYKPVQIPMESMAPAAALLFLGPHHPFIIDITKTRGFLCLFSKTFFNKFINGKLQKLPIYNEGKGLFVNEDYGRRINGIFVRMLAEVDSNYAYRDDLIRNYIFEIIHLGLKWSHHPDCISYKD